MGGVDHQNQLGAYYPCDRKTLRWYKKLGIRVIHFTLMNMNLQSDKPKLPELLGNITTLHKTILKCYIKPEQRVGDLNIGSVMINNPHTR
jgi:hypothetical protein